MARTRHPLQPKTWSAAGIDTRFDCIAPYVKGRRVLDLGSATGWHMPGWGFGRIRQCANVAVGLDLDPEMVAAANAAHGTDIMVGDAQDFDLGARFDVIHAGEIIEHLDDFSGFLAAAKRHLEADGKLVLTTPNAFAFTNFIYRAGWSPRINTEHTCWFCEDTLRELLSRNGFTIDTVEYLPHRTPGVIRGGAARLVRQAVPHRLRWNTMLAVSTPNGAS